jgi:hypothetical protein
MAAVERALHTVGVTGVLGKGVAAVQQELIRQKMKDDQ